MRGLRLLLVVALATSMAGFAAADASTRQVDDAVGEAADSTGLDRLVREILLQAPGEGPSRGVDDSAAGAMSTAAATGRGAWSPLDNLAKGIVTLGLEIIAGFFVGMAQGASTFGQAMATIGAAPAESAQIAVAALGLLGLLASLWTAAHRYGGIGLIPLFSRIAKSELLEHKLRADIFELIKTAPGVNVSEIARRLDVAWGTVTHHLQKLRQERLVAIRVEGHQKLYFPNGGSYTTREMDVMTATKSANAHRIADYLVKGGAASHQEISDALGLSPALVSHHARRLVEAGVVARQRQGRHTLYTALEANLAPAARPMRHDLTA